MSKVDYQAKNIPVSECFDYLSGNTGLTVRTIHHSKSVELDCIVLSSSLQDDTSLGYIDSKTILSNGKALKLFKNKEGIVISRNGYAGTMSYLSPGLYTLTDHAYILYLRDDNKYNIDLNWFILSFQKSIREEYLTTKAGNQTFSITRFMKDFKFDIPTIELQKEISNKYQVLNKEKEALLQQKNKITSFALESISGFTMIEKKLLEIFTPHQGNALYTKKNINNNGWKGDIPVISSNTDNGGILDYIDGKYIKLEELVKVPCLTWSVDGYAGKLFARNLEDSPTGFVANNHCGILFPKTDVIDISKIYFPYLVFMLQPSFFKNAKNSANKKLGNNQLDNIKVQIPIDEDGNFDYAKQVEIANIYQTVERLKVVVASKIDELIDTDITLF